MTRISKIAMPRVPRHATKTMYTLSHGKGTSERKSVRITLEC